MLDSGSVARAYKRWGTQYTSAVFRYAAVPHEGRPTLLRGVFRFSRDAQGKDSTLDYEGLVLSSVSLAPEEALQAIKNIAEGNPVSGLDLSIPSQFRARSVEPFHEGLPSPSHMRGWDNEWPGVVAVLEAQEAKVNEPHGPLVKASLPLAMDPGEAINEWLGLEPEGISNFHRSVAVMLPDYRCRISAIVVAEKSTKVQFESSIPRNRLLLKAGAGYENRHHELSPKRHQDEFIVSTPKGFPERYGFYLLDSEDEEVLDWQEFYIGWAELPGNVKFEIPEQHLGYLVETGESVTLEYKELIKPGDWDRVMATVVAMTNTQGGRILVGVTDEAEIRGVADRFPSEDDLARALREWVDPYLECGISEISVQSKEIIMIEVPEGTQKPYFHKLRGPLVRRGSNNYPMPREESLNYGTILNRGAFSHW